MTLRAHGRRAVAAPGQRRPAFDRLAHRLRAGVRIPVQVASDPGPEPERGARQPAPPDGQEVTCGVPEAVLDEPERLPDLVHDAWPVGANLVGLPEDRDLLCEPPPVPPRSRGVSRGSSSPSSSSSIRRCFSRIVLGSASVGCAVSTSSTETPAAARPSLVADAGRPSRPTPRPATRGASRPRARSPAGAGPGGAARRCSRDGSRW